MRPLLPLTLALLVAAPIVAAWGNGSSSNAEFRYYGVHDAISHMAWEKLRAHDPQAAAWLSHWYLPNPGGYGNSYNPANLKPANSDNLLGYSDDPDSVLQDWCNHLYMVHPRPDANEQCGPAHVGNMMQWATLNLTLSLALGDVACNPLEHMAAYNAGVLAHYVGDLSQWGHTDDTRKDHSHPPDDPDDRTYHGYYESMVWGSAGLRALQADQRARPWTPDVITDVPAAVRALAVRTNMPDGVTVSYRDTNQQTVSVGSQYRDMLVAYVQAYDAGQSYHGMRGYTPALFAQTMTNIAGSVDLLADLWYTVWVQASAAVPARAPASLALPGCSPA